MFPCQVIIAEKTDAEASLEEALPALEEARIALSDLDKSDVTEIRCVFHFPEVLYLEWLSLQYLYYY